MDDLMTPELLREAVVVEASSVTGWWDAPAALRCAARCSATLWCPPMLAAASEAFPAEASSSLCAVLCCAVSCPGVPWRARLWVGAAGGPGESGLACSPAGGKV